MTCGSHRDEARHLFRPGRNNRTRSAATAGESSNATSHASNGVEIASEWRFTNVVRTAQMLRQSVIILLLGDDSFREHSIERFDVSRFIVKCVKQQIGGDSMLDKELYFRRERSSCPSWKLAARRDSRNRPRVKCPGFRD